MFTVQSRNPRNKSQQYPSTAKGMAVSRPGALPITSFATGETAVRRKLSSADSQYDASSTFEQQSSTSSPCCGREQTRRKPLSEGAAIGDAVEVGAPCLLAPVTAVPSNQQRIFGGHLAFAVNTPASSLETSSIYRNARLPRVAEPHRRRPRPYIEVCDGAHRRQPARSVSKSRMQSSKFRGRQSRRRRRRHLSAVVPPLTGISRRKYANAI